VKPLSAIRRLRIDVGAGADVSQTNSPQTLMRGCSSAQPDGAVERRRGGPDRVGANSLGRCHLQLEGLAPRSVALGLLAPTEI
jgi:hypothetical protein